MGHDDTTKRERFLTAILDSIQDGVSVLGPDLTILYTNKIMEQWYRASMPIVGRKCYQAYHGSDVACDPCPTIRALESGSMETQIVAGLPGSDARWLELFTFPMLDAKTGEVTAVVEYVRDVTAKVEAERKLQEEKKKLELLREIDKAILSSQCMQDILDHSLPGIQKLLSARRVTMITFDGNSKLGVIRGLSEDMAVPLRVGQTVPLELFGFDMSKMDSVLCIEDLRRWPHKRSEHELLIKSGLRSLLFVPIGVDTQSFAILGAGYDKPCRPSKATIQIARELADHLAIALRQAELVERIHQQNRDLELRVAQRTRELYESNRAFEEFAYSVSHDLRAPLRAIGGFSEIIARRYKDRLDDEGKHYFDNIVEAAGRMGELISDLLAYSRLGKSGVTARTVDLSSLFEQVLSGFKGTIEETGAQVLVSDELPTVEASPTLLTQVLTNLIDNALKYHKPDVAPRIEITARREDGETIISVADNGLGIAPEHLDKIFNVFQRLHSHEEYPGTGIGLATVKKAASLLGGHVEVTSELGKGSVFSLHLPSRQGSKA